MLSLVRKARKLMLMLQCINVVGREHFNQKASIFFQREKAIKAFSTSCSQIRITSVLVGHFLQTAESGLSDC